MWIYCRKLYPQSIGCVDLDEKEELSYRLSPSSDHQYMYRENFQSFFERWYCNYRCKNKKSWYECSHVIFFICEIDFFARHLSYNLLNAEVFLSLVSIFGIFFLRKLRRVHEIFENILLVCFSRLFVETPCLWVFIRFIVWYLKTTTTWHVCGWAERFSRTNYTCVMAFAALCLKNNHKSGII